MGHYHDVIQELREPTKALRDLIPEVWAGFAEMHGKAVGDGVLPARIKELIALAISVHEGCDGCIAYHARAAAKRGATVEEAAEAIGVALLMGGGPASVHGPRAFQAFQEFAD
jgi:AhpD family alkylhydroperoxidase